VLQIIPTQTAILFLLNRNAVFFIRDLDLIFYGYTAETKKEDRSKEPEFTNEEMMVGAGPGAARECDVESYSAQGLRQSMEDAHLIADVDGGKLFAVFDGHGGPTVAKWAKDGLKEKFEEVRSTETSDSAALAKALVDLDKDISEKDDTFYVFGINGTLLVKDVQGSTAIVGYVKGNKLSVANLGDSRLLVIGADGSIKFATMDHKPDNEKERIESAGGEVVHGRVNGILAVSRSLGDWKYRGTDNVKLVSNEADKKDIELENGDIVLLACDGLFDVMSNEEVGQFVVDPLREKSAQETLRSLIMEAFKKGSTDNISGILYEHRGSGAGDDVNRQNAGPISGNTMSGAGAGTILSSLLGASAFPRVRAAASSANTFVKDNKKMATFGGLAALLAGGAGMYGFTQRIHHISDRLSREIESLRMELSAKEALSPEYMQALARKQSPFSGRARRVLQLRSSLNRMILLRRLAGLLAGVGVVGTGWGGSHYLF